MQRRANWTPVIVSNRDVWTEGDTKVSQADDAVADPTFPALPPSDARGLSENVKSLDQKNSRQADLRFAIGVAIALGLPTLIGLGVYVAAESIMLIASRISFLG
jgi:hypothetical protein